MPAGHVSKNGATRLWLICLFLLAAMGIACAAFLHFDAGKKELVREKQEDLSAMAQLKVDEFSVWLRERMADAKAIQGNPFALDLIELWPAGSEDVEAFRGKILAWMESLRHSYSYDAVLLLDRTGALRLASHPDAFPENFPQAKLAEAVNTREPVLMDFHRDEETRRIHLDLLVPLFSLSAGDARHIGFMALRIDPGVFLYPLIQHWPTQSPSGETLMVRREGDDVLFLNELRHRKDAALSLQCLPGDSKMPEAMAVRGVRGVVEGVDYRGVPVLAAIESIPGTPWILVSKVDSEEIYAPVRQRSRMAGLIVCLLILMTGAVAVLIWRHCRARFYWRQYQAELEKRKLARRYEDLSKYANDAILLSDETGRIVDANDRAMCFYGYSKEELLAFGIRDLIAPEAASDLDDRMQRAWQPEGLVFETLHRRADGSVFPVEVSSRMLPFDDGTLCQSIVRDISERKLAEAKSMRFNRLYAVLSQVNQLIVRTRNREELFREICRIAVVFGKFRMSWIGVVDHDACMLWPVAHEGAGEHFVSNLAVSLQDEPGSRCPTGTAARGGERSYCNDVENDPELAPWSHSLLELGVRSCASLPIRLHGQIVGVVSVYAGEPDFFDEDEMKLFEEVGMDISFGLEKIADEIQRERAEAALRASEERFRAIFREAAISIFLMEPGGRLLAVNRAMQTCFGYTEEEFSAMHYGQFVHPDEASSCMEQFAELFSGSMDATPAETRRYVKKDGRFLWGSHVASAIRNSRGNVELIVGMIEDVTARKESHETIVQARDFYLTLFDGFPALIWRAGVDGKYNYFNATWLAFTGRPLESERGYGWTEGVHPEDLDGCLKAFLHAFRVREPFKMEYRLRRHDGEFRWIMDMATPYYDFDGVFAGYVGSCYDITDRKMAEKKLAESERKLREMLENVQLVALSVDRDGLVTFCNDYLLDLTGWTRDEVLGASWYDRFVPEEERDTGKTAYQWRMQMKTMPGHYESNILTRAGRRRTISWNVTNLTDALGNTVGAVSIGEDVTDRKHLETQLRQAQKMEAIGTLAGGIAHDFNNILAAILGYTEIAFYNTAEGNPVRANLQQVLKASNRARELIGQILAFSRQSEQERRPIQLGLVTKEALKLLRASIPSTIEIRQDVSSGTSFVLADPTQMHQVIMNLCTNAAYAMQERGGLLDVGIRDVAVDAASNPDLNPGVYVRLSVSDTGCGMDRATMERIFDPFFTTKEMGTGTGMGLAVVHGIVKNHGGAVSVFSEPGRGSTFHVFFPKLESAGALEPEKHGELTHGEGCILFVDDEEALVNLGGKLLRMLGYEVVGKTSSVAALEAFRNEPERFDLVVTDFTMPQMTGIDMAEELVRIRSDIPIILCTGYSEKLSENVVREQGIAALLLKPLSVGQLAEAVSAALLSRRNRE
ncbi:MAG: PAS domain S-box protein [Desulfobacteraceae bacterium]|nr:PAS domain S-box protein [Desulfobacteraceae bacterium]